METMSFGDKGANVELLQLGLKRADFLKSQVDGIFGSNTLDAVLNFQNLQSTGSANSATWEALTPYLTGVMRYTIKAGDTYGSLADKYNTTASAIETANPNLRANALQIGTTISIPLDFDVVPTDISFSSALMEFALVGLKTRYPFIRTGVIGESILGHNIHYIDIGGGKNNVFYNASHHANEWITSTLLMKFLENYAKAVVSDEDIGGLPASDIYRASTITLVPLVNPEGVDLVTGALSGAPYNFAGMLSENYPWLDFPSGWKANIRGVDLNLQYPAGWEDAREIKSAQGFRYPGPRDYVGPAPLSEPESRAVYDFTLERDFTLTLSYHSQGEVIYWKYDDYLPPHSWEIAQEFSRLSGYAAEETPEASGNAGYKDWFIQQFNRPGYTIEVGRGVNPLPIEQFDKIYQDNEPILALAAIIINLFA